MLHQEERNVAHSLRRRTDLYNVAAPHVDFRVHLEYLHGAYVPIVGPKVSLLRDINSKLQDCQPCPSSHHQESGTAHTCSSTDHLAPDQAADVGVWTVATRFRSMLCISLNSEPRGRELLVLQAATLRFRLYGVRVLDSEIIAWRISMQRYLDLGWSCWAGFCCRGWGMACAESWKSTRIKLKLQDFGLPVPSKCMGLND